MQFLPEDLKTAIERMRLIGSDTQHYEVKAGRGRDCRRVSRKRFPLLPIGTAAQSFSDWMRKSFCAGRWLQCQECC